MEEKVSSLPNDKGTFRLEASATDNLPKVRKHGVWKKGWLPAFTIFPTAIF